MIQNTKGVSKRTRNECEQVVALAESRVDVKAGRFVKESPEDHVKRVKKIYGETDVADED